MELADFVSLKPTPPDAVSSVAFDSLGAYILASCWDNGVYCYDLKRVQNPTNPANPDHLSFRIHHNEPVLDACFFGNHVYSGGLDKSLKSTDLETLKESKLGSHNQAIRCIQGNSMHNMVITGSWDSTVKMWDPRDPQGVTLLHVPDKVYSMDSVDEYLLVATAGRQYCLLDLRTRSSLQKRESYLKYQLRCVRFFPSKDSFAASSIEGRVAIEYVDTNPDVQKKKYAFKCHRQKEESTEKVYPVNAIAVHPTYGTFATGGSDGFVSVWDGQNKKRLAQLKSLRSSVLCTSICMERAGAAGGGSGSTLLAVGTGNMFEALSPAAVNSVDAIPESDFEGGVYVRRLADAEARPKSMAAAGI